MILLLIYFDQIISMIFRKSWILEKTFWTYFLAAAFDKMCCCSSLCHCWSSMCFWCCFPVKINCSKIDHCHGCSYLPTFLPLLLFSKVLLLLLAARAAIHHSCFRLTAQLSGRTCGPQNGFGSISCVLCVWPICFGQILQWADSWNG